MALHAVAAAAAAGRGAGVFASPASCQERPVAPEMNIDLAQEALTCPEEKHVILRGHTRVIKITQT